MLSSSSNRIHSVKIINWTLNNIIISQVIRLQLKTIVIRKWAASKINSSMLARQTLNARLNPRRVTDTNTGGATARTKMITKSNSKFTKSYNSQSKVRALGVVKQINIRLSKLGSTIPRRCSSTLTMACWHWRWFPKKLLRVTRLIPSSVLKKITNHFKEASATKFWVIVLFVSTETLIITTKNYLYNINYDSSDCSYWYYLCIEF